MAIEMEIISKEMIKPSSPTPTHLRNLEFSFLDQIAAPIYVPMIFFYTHQQLALQNLSDDQISPLLKQSLSKILTTFYPLAGRIQENLSVDCDDSGIEFIEARVHTRLSEVIQDPDIDQLKKLEPVESLEHDENVLLKVKICFFGCGGVSVAICLSHKIGDATSLVAFMNAWAASCRGETQIPPPIFDLFSSIPPKDLSVVNSILKIGVTDEKMGTKRFVFDAKKITNLKNDFVIATNNGGSSQQVKNPTRVEVVSSFIWRFFIDSMKTTSVGAIHAVNLRPRRSPPFPQQMFGNCWRNTITALSEADDGYFDLVTKLRAAVEKVDDDLIRKIENGEYLNMLKKGADFYRNSGAEFVTFTSWIRFPVYEVDFGWGKPVWVCTTTEPFKNFVVFMTTPSGEGMEAWVSMVEDDLEKFEQHYNLLA